MKNVVEYRNDIRDYKAEIEKLQEERNMLTRKAIESQSLRELGYKTGEVVGEIEVISILKPEIVIGGYVLPL